MVIKKLAEESQLEREDIRDIILDVMMEDDSLLERIGGGSSRGAGTSRSFSAMGRKKGDAESASSCAWNKGAPAAISSDWKEKTLVDFFDDRKTDKLNKNQ